MFLIWTIEILDKKIIFGPISFHKIIKNSCKKTVDSYKSASVEVWKKLWSLKKLEVVFGGLLGCGFLVIVMGCFRLWAEVFHVSASGAGTVKWQQVSEDLVPVNITCIQDSPECVFHITAYNSQVDKILDVRLVQPGTRIGQASECFVYWKDPMTNDTWGLNFTSPIDAKQFRECCVS